MNDLHQTGLWRTSASGQRCPRRRNLTNGGPALKHSLTFARATWRVIADNGPLDLKLIPDANQRSALDIDEASNNKPIARLR